MWAYLSSKMKNIYSCEGKKNKARGRESMDKKRRIAVIFGGQSTEHEVSRVSAESVVRNINRDKYDVVMLGITKDGRWLSYDGPVEKLGTGEWQAIAEAKALERMKAPVGRTQAPACNAVNVGEEAYTEAEGENSAGCPAQKGILRYVLSVNSARSILMAAGAENGNRKIDVAFPVLHGCNGEDGTIQGLFELAGIPYVGSGVLGSALGMDKAYAKIIFEKEGIPQGKYLVFSRSEINRGMDEAVEKVEAVFSYPCFVKPSSAGSSVGITKARDRKGLAEGLMLALKYDRRVLVEEFINGREIECAVLGNDDPAASTVGEIIPCNEFYDYNAKYGSEGASQIMIPAKLPEETARKIRTYAVKAFKVLDCAGLARVDFFVGRETGEVYINEINTMPGFTSISMYPKLWEASGIPYPELIDRLVELAVERFEENRREVEI